MGTTVVHCKKEVFDVYIGRPGKWGNPFSHKPGTLAEFEVDTIEDAIEAFRQYMLAHPELIQEAKKELKGKVLGCWCKPGPCHGDVLVELIEN